MEKTYTKKEVDDMLTKDRKSRMMKELIDFYDDAYNVGFGDGYNEGFNKNINNKPEENNIKREDPENPYAIPNLALYNEIINS